MAKTNPAASPAVSLSALQAQLNALMQAMQPAAAAPAEAQAAAPEVKHAGQTFNPTVTLKDGKWTVTFEAWTKGTAPSSTGKSWLLGGGGTKVALPDGTQARLTVSLSVTK